MIDIHGRGSADVRWLGLVGGGECGMACGGYGWAEPYD